MRRFYSAALTFFLLFSLQLSAQTGKYDLNLVFSHVDCDSKQLYIDIQIRAHDGECSFRLSDQNYRLSFNKTLVPNSVFIEKELEVSGYIQSPTGYSFYQPHTLTGSLDSIISYNIEFTDGEGLLIESHEWTNVGQLGFDIADLAGTVNLMYLGENMFPATFVSEFYNQTRIPASAGTLGILDIDLQEYCVSTDIIDSEIENSVSLFPTLARDQIYLRCGDNICRDLGIIDVQGRVIRHWQEAQHSTSVNDIDISNLPNGTYFLRININEYYLVRRFVKI